MTTVTIMFPSKLILIAIFTSAGWAQFAQCGSGFEWNTNSLSQDPCIVGSRLDASCRDGAYTYPPLSSGQSYPSPSANDSSAMKCDCNTVIYSLYMACASCQGGQIYSWTQWKQQCDTVYIAKLPYAISKGTAVPYWAYDNITSLPNMTYSDAVAESIGRYPEETLTQSQVTTFVTVVTRISSTTGMSTSTGDSTVIPSPTNTSNATKGGTNGATFGIVGVLAVVVSLLLATLVFMSMRHYRRRRARQPQPQRRQGGRDPDGDPIMSDRPPAYPPRPAFYDPSDPSTFPPQHRSQLGAETGSAPSYNNACGIYSGAAEI